MICYKVLNSDNLEVLSQINPVWQSDATAFTISDARFNLVFEATVPALGMTTYYILYNEAEHPTGAHKLNFLLICTVPAINVVGKCSQASFLDTSVLLALVYVC